MSSTQVSYYIDFRTKGQVRLTKPPGNYIISTRFYANLKRSGVVPAKGCNMAKEKKVEQITDMEQDFAQWYTDICRKAELVEYASVKGFTILRPYGYAIWENIQQIMDGEFKKTGHMNVAMPVLIPESLLKKEGELVNGFAPEVAWVTQGGSEVLEERLAFRPTSETQLLLLTASLLA